MVESVINRKERFATEGIRFQRHNGDGTIPTPQRFLGFANTTDLSKVLVDNKAPLIIKIDDNPAVTKDVTFNVANPAKVTVQEAIVALNNASFPNILFSVDTKTERLKGEALITVERETTPGTKAEITITMLNETGNVITIPANNYSIEIEGVIFSHEVTGELQINDEETLALTFIVDSIGDLSTLPEENDDVDLTLISPALPGVDNTDFTGVFSGIVNGTNAVTVSETTKDTSSKIIQVVGKLAAALDFGNCIKHGGNGLEMISFFDDETISIGLPKDIKDKEEIDSEGAKGTITRMIIGAMIQGLSPVVTLKEKDYYFLELVQGGKLNRETGTYNPPLSHESEHPSFYAEIFSAIYSSGSNKMSDISGYERLLLRSMIGMEGDVPIDAKSWAQYAYNLTATEYTDEEGVKFTAWEEGTISATKFDALNVKKIKV
jgi:hypothetical protein